MDGLSAQPTVIVLIMNVTNWVLVTTSRHTFKSCRLVFNMPSSDGSVRDGKIPHSLCNSLECVVMYWQREQIQHFHFNLLIYIMLFI